MDYTEYDHISAFAQEVLAKTMPRTPPANRIKKGPHIKKILDIESGNNGNDDNNFEFIEVVGVPRPTVKDDT